MTVVKYEVKIVFSAFILLNNKYFRQNILPRLRDQYQGAKELYLICNMGFYNDPLLDWSNYRAAIQN